MQITSASEYPFQKVYIDFVNVERTHSNMYPCIFTCIDELTKFGIAVRAKNNTALLAARKFVKHIILKYNIPKSVVSDLGSAFTADIFKEITKLFKIKKISTTPYRPNANIVENFGPTPYYVCTRKPNLMARAPRQCCLCIQLYNNFRHWIFPP